jgi:hypothetical protein
MLRLDELDSFALELVYLQMGMLLVLGNLKYAAAAYRGGYPLKELETVQSKYT